MTLFIFLPIPQGDKGGDGQKGDKGDEGIPGRMGLPGKKVSLVFTSVRLEHVPLFTFLSLLIQGEKGTAGTPGTNGTDGTPGMTGQPGKEVRIKTRSPQYIYIIRNERHYSSVLRFPFHDNDFVTTLYFPCLHLQGLQGPKGMDGIPGIPGRSGLPGKKVRNCLDNMIPLC